MVWQVITHDQAGQHALTILISGPYALKNLKYPKSISLRWSVQINLANVVMSERDYKVHQQPKKNLLTSYIPFIPKKQLVTVVHFGKCLEQIRKKNMLCLKTAVTNNF